MNLFGHKTTPKVQLTYDVMMKCKCVTCPVQASSACAKPKIIARDELTKNMNPEKMKNMIPGMMQNMEMLKNMSREKMRSMSRDQMKNMSDEMMKNMPKEQIDAMMPKTEDMPGPYCANGVADCKDLDFSKTCICTGCQVFKDYNLMKGKPISYFCKDGKPT